jgi:hypothetical protein
MDVALNAMLASQRVPTDLIIVYDDMHGLWGGSILTARGDGHLERQVRPRGAPAPRSSGKFIGEPELLELVRLLVALSAWEQRTADGQPVPDESRAYLTISLKSEVSRMWERYNEMRSNNRLLRIKGWMASQFGDDAPDVPGV